MGAFKQSQIDTKNNVLPFKSYYTPVTFERGYCEVLLCDDWGHMFLVEPKDIALVQDKAWPVLTTAHV